MKSLRIYAVLIFSLVLTSSSFAQWVQTNGPYGGNVACFASSPNGSGGFNLFAGTACGIYLSTDNGLTWKAKSNDIYLDFNFWGVSTMAIIGNHIFAGNGNAGVYVSTDNGESWQAVDFGYGIKTNPVLAVSDTNLLVGNAYGIFLSPDYGKTWKKITPQDAYMPVGAMAVNGKEIFAAKGQNVYHSTDLGSTWTTISSGLEKTYGVNSLLIKGKKVFAGSPSGLFVLSDSGDQWLDASNGVTLYPYSLYTDGSNVFVGAHHALYMSSDDGTTWKTLRDVNDEGYYSVTTLGKTIFTSTDSCVYSSADSGKTWIRRNKGMANSAIWDLSVRGQTIYAGTTEGTYIAYSTDEGENWNYLRNPNYFFSYDFVGTDIFAANNNGLFGSTNSGQTWNQANGVPNSRIGKVAASGTNLLVSVNDNTYGGVYLSTDNGANWTLSDSGLTDKHVLTITSHGTDTYAGTVSGIFRSTDNGLTWTEFNKDQLNVGQIGFMDTCMFVIGGQGIYRASLNGTNWTSVKPELTTGNSNGTMKISGKNLFFSPKGVGIWLSTDYGQSWIGISEGLKNRWVTQIAVCGDNLYVGTDGTGVWRRPLAEILTAVNESRESAVPTEFRLEQNYPNPFNPSTTIRFSLPEASHVELSVYNAMGEEVSRLISQDMNAGVHSAQWNAQGFASGIYFYRMVTDKFSETKKLLLLK